MNAIQKLRQLHTDITTSGDGLKIVDAWATVARLLPRAVTDQARAARVLKEKDADELGAIIAGLENPGPTPEPAAEASAQEMKDALQAFRKRLKLARLNDESKLGGRYTSGGKRSAIEAIEPPREFPQRVWDALVLAGKLKNTGGGFYAETDQP